MSPLPLKIVIHLLLHLAISKLPLIIIPFPPRKKISTRFFLKSGVLHPTLHPFRNSSQTNKMTDEHPTHQIFKANLLFVYRTHTVYYAY